MNDNRIISAVPNNPSNQWYEVQHNTASGWVNTWTDTKEFEPDKPCTWRTRDEAQQELDEFLEERKEDCEDEEDYENDCSDWRVVRVVRDVNGSTTVYV